MNIEEKAAYLKGLLQGMDYDTDTKEGKLFTEIIDLLGEMAEEIIDLRNENEMQGNYIEEIDEDLGELEETLYGLDHITCGDADCECDEDYDDDFDDEDEEDDDMCCSSPGFRAVVCPHCDEDVYIESGFSDEEIVCPHCFETIKISECEDDSERI